MDIEQSPPSVVQPAPPASTLPPIPKRAAPRHEPEIPHSKAMPDPPKQGARPFPERAPSSPRQVDPAPSSVPPGLSKSTETPIGPLAQAVTPPEPAAPSNSPKPSTNPSPIPRPLETVDELRGKNTHPLSDETDRKESSSNWMFRNLGFGLGIGWTHNLGSQRIESATLVNGTVRVDADQNDLVRFMPEVHLWVDQWDEQRWSWGPFLSVAPGSQLIDAIGFGVMLGYRPHQTDRYSFNVGIGGSLDFNTRVLGDGLSANQRLPAGETQVRTKQTSSPGFLLMLSVGWDLGPRRSPPPQVEP